MLYTIGKLLSSTFQIREQLCAASVQCAFIGEFTVFVICCFLSIFGNQLHIIYCFKATIHFIPSPTPCTRWRVPCRLSHVCVLLWVNKLLNLNLLVTNRLTCSQCHSNFWTHMSQSMDMKINQKGSAQFNGRDILFYHLTLSVIRCGLNKITAID